MNECFDENTLSQYVDGELDEETQHQVEEHLTECSDCKTIVARLRSLDAALSDWGREWVRARFEERSCLSDEQFLGYLDNSLSEQERAVVQQHIEACVACAQELSLTKRDVSLFEQDQLPQPPTDFTEALLGILPTDTTGTGDLLKFVRGAAQALAELVFGQDWQWVSVGGSLGTKTESPDGGSAPPQECILRLTTGPLAGTEVEYTPDDRLIIKLKHPVPAGSYLRLLTEAGEEVQLPIVRPLDARGRASYDVSTVSKTLAFRLVVVEEQNTEEG